MFRVVRPFAFPSGSAASLTCWEGFIAFDTPSPSSIGEGIELEFILFQARWGEGGLPTCTSDSLCAICYGPFASWQSPWRVTECVYMRKCAAIVKNVLNLVFSGGGVSCQGDHRLKLYILASIISCIASLACPGSNCSRRYGNWSQDACPGRMGILQGKAREDIRALIH